MKRTPQDVNRVNGQSNFSAHQKIEPVKLSHKSNMERLNAQKKIKMKQAITFSVEQYVRWHVTVGIFKIMMFVVEKMKKMKRRASGQIKMFVYP